MNRIAILILAAGRGSRMGSIKQLLPYHGDTLLGHVIKIALASKAYKVYCVLGANSEAIRATIKTEAVTFIENKHWKQGLSSSIIAGIEHLQTIDKHLEGVLILLADQPNIGTNYINRLLKTYQTNTPKIIASLYNNFRGVPAIVPSNHFKNLLLLEGDQGAKMYLNSLNSGIVSVNIESQSLIDIDTQDDYERFLNSNRH